MMFGKQKEFGVWLNRQWAFRFRLTFDAYYLRVGPIGARLPRKRSRGADEWDDLRYALSLRDFEPQSRREYALIPWWLVRWFFAWFLTLFRAPLLNLNWWIRGRYWTLFMVTRYVLPLHMGRSDDTNPIICPRCLWAGMRRWAVHGYAQVGFEDDVEPCDECPRCGAEI